MLRLERRAKNHFHWSISLAFYWICWLAVLDLPQFWFFKLSLGATPVALWEKVRKSVRKTGVKTLVIFCRGCFDLFQPVFIAGSGEYYTLQRTTHIYCFCVYIKSFPFYLYKKRLCFVFDICFLSTCALNWNECLHIFRSGGAFMLYLVGLVKSFGGIGVKL